MHDAVMSGVILGGEAVAAGVVTRHELRRWYRNLYRGVYVEKDRDVSLRDRAIGAWLRFTAESCDLRRSRIRTSRRAMGRPGCSDRTRRREVLAAGGT